MKINMIVATSKTAAIGKDNSLLWQMRSDLKRFKELTIGRVLIMGRKTYESIGGPLPNRRIFVLSQNTDALPNQDCSVRIFNDKDRLLNYLRLETTIDEVWVAGGATIYSLFEDVSHELHWSIIDTTVEGDVYWQPNMSIWETKQVSVCPKATGDQFNHEYHILVKKENEQ